MLTRIYSYEGYIQPKYCKCCMQKKINLSFAMATNQIQQFRLIHMVVRGLLRNITVKLLSKNLSQIEIKAYFHFSHYKSMEN